MYTDEQKQFLVVKQHVFKGDWDLITHHFNKQYGLDKAPDSLRRIFDIWYKDGKLDTFFDEAEVLAENVKFRKQTTKARDIARLLRKAGRHIDRADNAIEELSRSLIEVMKNNPLEFKTKEYEIDPVNKIGLLHFTDAHFNEIIDLRYNKYDFKIASARCKELVRKATVYFKANDVQKVVFAMTGDMINSDRLPEEAMTNATNRAQAMFLAVEIISSMIKDLNDNGFNIAVVSVAGNESRLEKDISFARTIVSGNYDITIQNMLQIVFEGNEGVEIIMLDNKTEGVITIHNINILMVHGHQRGFSKPADGINKLVRKYNDRGIIINFVIFGHLHECRISDLYARAASVAGANSYSDEALMLTSRASQNVHIISSIGIDSIKIDLQNVNIEDRYDITEKLEAYHAKSAQKPTVIYAPVTIKQ